MLSIFMLSITAVVPVSLDPIFPCAGIAMVEGSMRDRPRPFASLRQFDKEMVSVRDASGRRVQREVDVTNVKPLAGFTNCRFIYSAQIDLACYVGSTLPDTQTDAISAKLVSVAESIGNCLDNPALVRSESEPGSTPSITFGGGARQSFWQISMVPSPQDPSLVQPELIVLGPSEFTVPPPVRARVQAPVRPQIRRPATKARRKAR